MKVGVVGLWHLGTVTAACLAQAGHWVTAFDDQAETVEGLRHGQLPVAEPRLAEMVASGVESGRLRFVSNPDELNDSEVIWITYDTPVDDDDRADADIVVVRVKRILTQLTSIPRILVSSQVPVGTTAKLDAWYRQIRPQSTASFAYSPENLRLGQAIESFTRPSRVVIGARLDADKDCFGALFAPFSDRIEWMSVESAEMAKHALNAFLATSITFANELAILCERVGADARDVERALRGDPRIGPKAYVRAGSAFAGGTLARDLAFLVDIGQKAGVATPLFNGIQSSNRLHLQWTQNVLSALGSIDGQIVAVLGLTYKPGTNTLRRSSAVEVCRWLANQGAKVVAYDPAVSELPSDLRPIVSLVSNAEDALRGSSVAIVATEWPEFATISPDDLSLLMKMPTILDAGRFLEARLGFDRRLRYFAVGRGERL